MGLEKINEMRKFRGMEIDELSEKSGVPKGTLSKITAGITKHPSIENVKAIVHAMGFTLDDLDNFPNVKRDTTVSIEALEIAKKYQSLDPHGQEVVNSVIDIETKRMKAELAISKEVAIPLYSIPYACDLVASAGTGEFTVDVANFINVGLSIKPPKDANFLVRISGDSMEPEFFDGDKVFIKREDAVKDNDIGLFCLEGHMYIKQQEKDMLISFNSEYAPIHIDDDAFFKCYGKVIGKCECEIIEI